MFEESLFGRPGPGPGSCLAGFHPAVRAWFESRFPDGPTAPQTEGWPHIAGGADTLIAAPTGSGKTLAGFLVCIDELYRAAERGEAVNDHTQVVYVSPLKALAVDIQQNLEAPLGEIAKTAVALGYRPPALTVQVRNGDTTASARAAMLRHPPNFLVTTPESLYLYVTAERSRATLASVGTVIVDEIHAVARDKRGSHLALTLERLERLCRRRPQRVGLSATQRPIETVARLLVGAGAGSTDAAGRPAVEIVDVGHRRTMDLAIELPDGELEAVASGAQLDEVLDRIAGYVTAHRTTLVFVNTRRMAERIAHLLGERLGDDVVAAHHGSLSKDRRLRVETRLRAGELRALVATASLELGIDIGPVELVCQIASPRSLATFLQRVGRSGHSRGGIPKGRLFPMTRDELVECCALLAGVRAGRLDAIHPPEAPLDILAQQIVAECAAERWRADDLFALVRRAAPYAGLRREDFDEVVALVSDGIETGRGRRAAYIHHDRVNGELTGRRGARLAALTSGGAIPETGDYRVVADPDDTFVGTVNEDWAIESMAGDVFLLGSTSWRIRRVEPGTVRVADAHGAPPSVPFWLGEAPARTAELSEEVSALRAGVEAALAGGGADGVDGAGGGVGRGRRWVEERCGVDGEVAGMVVRYLAAGRAALGVLPGLDHVVVERFFDDSGGMQLILHAPFGGRINRALGLALRKRFCVSFDFELQAAASDDAVLLSLGPQHSFPLESVTRFLSSASVESVLRQAALASPMFAARWRWNLNRALTVLRYRGGRKNPAPIQRMEADDLMVALFPALAACQENATGPVVIPDHPLVRQTMFDCLHEAMDVDGLKALVAAIETGAVAVTCRDTTEPSPLAHEILSGRPYTFLDDAPLEERRSRAVTLRRGLPVESRDLSALDPAAIERVRGEARPEPRDADELHDVLLGLVVCRESVEWRGWMAELSLRRRAMTVSTPTATLWCAAERRPAVEGLFPGSTFDPELGQAASTPGTGGPAGRSPGDGDREAGLPQPAGTADIDVTAASCVRGHLDVLGPVTLDQLVEATTLDPGTVSMALARLEQEGFALQGHFDPGSEERQWCARRLLARIHGYTQHRLRREIEPVTAQDLIRFVLRWQHVAPGHQAHGRAGLLPVIAQLQGFEIPAGSWEQSVLPARVAGYRSEWLDQLCQCGELVWGRLKVRDEGDGGGGPGTITSRATPVTMMVRADLPWLLQAARGDARPAAPSAGATHDVIEALREQGALFLGEVAASARRLPAEVENALWDGVARGLVTADGFGALRALLAGRQPASRRDWQPRRPWPPTGWQARRGSDPGREGPLRGERQPRREWQGQDDRRPRRQLFGPGDPQPGCEWPNPGDSGQVDLGWQVEANGQGRLVWPAAAPEGDRAGPTGPESPEWPGGTHGVQGGGDWVQGERDAAVGGRDAGQGRRGPPASGAWPPARGLRRGAGGHAASGGRWSLLPGAGPVDDRDALAEAVAEQLLARWGVVFRDVLARETLTVPWRDVLWALRRLEARGVVRGGRFVTGFTGEQYALPEAVEQLRAVRRERRDGEVVRVPATDPVNLVGILTPGPRVPAVRTNTVTYRDGLPIADDARDQPGVGAGQPA